MAHHAIRAIRAADRAAVNAQDLVAARARPVDWKVGRTVIQSMPDAVMIASCRSLSA